MQQQEERPIVQSILNTINKKSDMVSTILDEQVAQESNVLNYVKKISKNKTSNNKTRPELGLRAKANNKKKKAAKKARRLNRNK